RTGVSRPDREHAQSAGIRRSRCGATVRAFVEFSNPPSCVEEGDMANDANGLGRDKLIAAYRTMRTIREFEERVHERFAAGELPGAVHLYVGQEAVAAGVCAALA